MYKDINPHTIITEISLICTTFGWLEGVPGFISFNIWITLSAVFVKDTKKECYKSLSLLVMSFSLQCREGEFRICSYFNGV